MKVLGLFIVFLFAVSCTQSDKSSSEASPEAGALSTPAATSCNVDSGTVCGGDGKTYENECKAHDHGLDSYESGICEEMQ